MTIHDPTTIGSGRRIREDSSLGTGTLGRAIAGDAPGSAKPAHRRRWPTPGPHLFRRRCRPPSPVGQAGRRNRTNEMKPRMRFGAADRRGRPRGAAHGNRSHRCHEPGRGSRISRTTSKATTTNDRQHHAPRHVTNEHGCTTNRTVRDRGQRQARPVATDRHTSAVP